MTLDEPRLMRSFEKIFDVPATHRLVMVRSRSTGVRGERTLGCMKNSTTGMN